MHRGNPWAPLEDAKNVLRSTLSMIDDQHPGVDVGGEVMRGNPGKMLTETAAHSRAAMLVVGSRGQGGFQSLLMGSVSHHCLHHATTAVVVVTAPTNVAQE